MNVNRLSVNFCVLVILNLFMLSCKTYHNIAYFKDLPDTSKVNVSTVRYKNIEILNGDILNITIMTIDPAANSVFIQGASANMQSNISNLSSNLSSSSSNQILPNSQTYTVDKNGDIEIPLLGKFQAAGLITDTLRDHIQMECSRFYKSPAVIVKFANFKINVLGEVLRPGSYTMQNEKNTIFDALALAGDLTIYGKRENVILMRDSAGVTQVNRFSLNSKELFRQSFYYLKQNDVIYVEPAIEKIASLDADQARRVSIAATVATSVLTLLIVIVTRIK